MPLQETSGTASYDAFGGGAPVAAKYIEQYFSTWLRTGTGASATITTGLDASANKALVWTKSRSAATDHKLTDTVRGATKALISDTTGAQTTDTNGLTAFSSTGYTIGSDTNYNNSGATYVDWEFVATPKFFDVVTFTTDGSGNATFNHSLGSTPGCIFVKKVNDTSPWYTYHRSLAANQFLLLNTAGAAQTYAGLFSSVTSTSVSMGALSASQLYVAYLFAHNAGGFGLTGTDNVISCGSFTTDGSGNATVTLGYEPQWVMEKSTNYADNWYIADNMRGMANPSPMELLSPNTSGAASSYTGGWYPTSTGFYINTGNPSSTYIYIAIRRGPMKTPTSGTSVFAPVAQNLIASASTVTTNFPVDLNISAARGRTPSALTWVFDRLRGNLPTIATTSTAAEFNSTGGISFASNTSVIDSYWGTDQGASGQAGIYWNFRRAPGFFDEVCYTGNGVNNTARAHNLGVAPEMMIVKKRSSATNSYWIVSTSALGFGNQVYLNLTNAANASGNFPTNPDASNFYVGTSDFINASGSTYVAYLFASCPGVSKVGSYTGNGSTQTIDCGFTGGARFVLIKRTDSTGDWYVYDTARGMTTLTDPYLLLNSTAAESATLGSVTTVSSGFAVDASILAAINTNGGSYIFLAIS